MRFYNYINEVSLKEDMHIDEINKIIHQDCKHYLNLTQGTYMFKRGMEKLMTSFGLEKVKQNRSPKGTDSLKFSMFNKWLEQNGHVRRDKITVIATNISGYGNQFGDAYWIFPIGKFNYTWIKAKDVNLTDKSTGWHENSTNMMFNDVNSKDITKHGYNTYFTTNKGIKEAYKNKYEIWFDCKEYYYFLDFDFEWNTKQKKLIKRD